MTNGVCAIVVTYRIGKDLRRCFEAVRGQVQETVFVDNGGDEETTGVLGEIERTQQDVKVFYNPQNMGIAAAFNIGVRYALQKSYRWVLTLDHDSEAMDEMVDELVNAHDHKSEGGANRVAIVGARTIDRNVPSPAGPASEGSQVREVATCISSGSLIGCDVFADVGFFNESLFMYYVDDDFCLRCADRGWKVCICDAAQLSHSEGHRQIRRFMGRSFIYRNYGPSARYYMARNAIYMLKKHLRHGRYSWAIVKRLCSDLVTTTLFGQNRLRLIRFIVRGYWHGLIGK
jgi:rhamnosyltransferase